MPNPLAANAAQAEAAFKRLQAAYEKTKARAAAGGGTGRRRAGAHRGQNSGFPQGRE